MTRGLLLGVCALAAGLGGCGLLFEFRAATPEGDAAACGDGTDNDLDSLIDCGDPDCNGYCAEKTAEECSDGRDNDGDGLPDAADPRCWRFAPPQAERCATASGVETIDGFDRPAWGGIHSFWHRWGVDDSGFIVASSSDAKGARKDPRVAFGGMTSSPEGSAPGLGAFVRQRPFSGSFRDFELSFSALVPAGAMLRAGIVPLGLSPTEAPPLPGAENALFALTLDGSQSPPTLTLSVEGEPHSTPVSAGGCVGAACEGALVRVRVSVSSLGSRATLTYLTGEITELTARAPSSMSLPASRLVFWGGSSDVTHPALLDDLRMSVKPESPCGHAVPVLPGQGCELAGQFGQFGHTVSLAKRPTDGYCALVTASPRDPSWFYRGVALPGPTAVTAWRSLDGQSFVPASSPGAPVVDLPAGATLIGAGIASDATFHAAVNYRESDGVRLGFLDADDCAHWGALELGPALPDDAEAPSYVITGRRHDVYFTRPPTDQTRRTLWRIARDGSATAPELLSELPVGVTEPVSVALAGGSDLVLTYPTRPASGNGGGVGLLVAGVDLLHWESPTSSPVLELPPGLDLSDGQGRLSFDDRGVVAAALAWDENGGFFLYSGSSTNGLVFAGTFQPFLAVGTARLVPAGDTFPDASAALADACGDGECKDPEDCDSCEADCSCAGANLLGDAFARGSDWALVSSEPNSEASRYLDVDPPSLRWASAEPTWSVLPLERPLTGDFELSFDMFIGFTDPDEVWECSLYVGLGTMPEPDAARNSDAVAPRTGLFARFRTFSDWYFPVTLAKLENATFAGADALAPEALVAMDSWQHVTLRREGNQLSLKSPKLDGCGSLDRGVTFSGPVSELDSLLIGFGGGDFEGCPQLLDENGYGTDGQGAFKNVTLRLLDDPDSCPPTKERCGTDSAEPTCVDTLHSPEHCGACVQRCGPNEDCHDGECSCSTAPGMLACDGACVNGRSSIEHCGSCGNACGHGPCVGGTCTIAGDCDSPFVMDPEGGSVVLDMPRATSSANICEVDVLDEVVISWTPPRTAVGVFSVDVGDTDLDTVIGISEDGACGPSCAAFNDDIVLGELLGSHLTYGVTKDVKYQIRVGIMAAPLLDGTTAELTIELSQ